jgi:hypothetical protein
LSLTLRNDGMRVTECFGEYEMSKEHEYRDYAVTLMKLAQRAQGSSDRSRLLALAEAWLDLAERAAAQSPLARLLRLYPKRAEETTRPEAE